MYLKTENMPKKIVFGLILSCFSIGVQAINLGSLNIISEKNQPLKAELDLGNLSEPELRALRLEFSSSDNTDLKSYGIQSTIEKKGKTYFAKIITIKPLPISVLDLKVKTNINGNLTEKSYSNLLKGSQNKPIDSNDIIKANPVPNKSIKSSNAPIVSGSNGKYVVQDGDNLYSISGTHSKNLQDVSLDQVIVAIYQSNPQAFNNGNMNRLRSGSELALPTSEQAAGIDQKSAKLEITARTTQYSKYRNKVINFVNKRAPETQATTSQKGNVNTQSKQVQITENAKDNLQIQKSASNDKKEQDVAKQLNNQESKEVQEQKKVIEDSKKDLENKKQELVSSSTEQLASNAESNNTQTLPSSSTNVAEDERHTNPLGLPTSSSQDTATSSTTENKAQGTLSTTADVASKTQLAVKNKSTGIWPFLIMLFGAGGIGYFIYKKRKKEEQEEEYDSLFVHNTKSKDKKEINSDSHISEFDNMAQFSQKPNNFLQNALNSSSSNVHNKDVLDDGLDGDLADFNLGVQEDGFNKQTFSNNSNINNDSDDHLFADGIPLIEDMHKDDDLFKGSNSIGFAEDEININNVIKSDINDNALPYKSEVVTSIDDLNFDDIPTLSMDDQIEQSSQSTSLILDDKQQITNTNKNNLSDSIDNIQVNSIEENKENSNNRAENNQSDQKDNGFYETKLELAKAYLDIEDFSGASMLLDELVSQNEDKKVQKQAKALLKDINEM